MLTFLFSYQSVSGKARCPVTGTLSQWRVLHGEYLRPANNHLSDFGALFTRGVCEHAGGPGAQSCDCGETPLQIEARASPRVTSAAWLVSWNFPVGNPISRGAVLH